MVRDWYVPHQRQLTRLNICKYMVRDWYAPHQRQLPGLRYLTIWLETGMSHTKDNYKSNWTKYIQLYG